VPFRGRTLAEDAQQTYARWMAAQSVAGVAVWAHTGRGPHLSVEERRSVLSTWRRALPDKVIVAGANSPQMAREARPAGRMCCWPSPSRRSCPLSGRWARAAVLAFYLYEAAGGVAYDGATIRALLDLPQVIGIKGGDARLGDDVQALPDLRDCPTNSSSPADGSSATR
jgi:4-hydroxy-tetrahydrodipicolinate synthase